MPKDTKQLLANYNQVPQNLPLNLRFSGGLALKEKFDNYTSIPSLLEYVVVSQDVPLVRLFRRRTSWEWETYRADDVFRLESVELDVPVQHIYRRVRKEVGLAVSY